jgi:hypothetical protein
MVVHGSIQVGTTTIPLDDKQTMTTSNLVLPNAKKGQRWPQSGSVTVVRAPHHATERDETFHIARSSSPRAGGARG